MEENIGGTKVAILELLAFSIAFSFFYFLANIPYNFGLEGNFFGILLFPYLPFGLQVLACLYFRIRSYLYIPLGVFFAISISEGIQDTVNFQIIILLSLLIPLAIDFLLVGLKLRFNINQLLSPKNLILGLVPAVSHAFAYTLIYDVSLKFQVAYVFSDLTGYIFLTWVVFANNLQTRLASDESVH